MKKPTIKQLQKVQARVDKDVARVIRKSTTDSFQNFAARLGIGTDNLSSGSTYGFNPITRVRTLLEWMYRGSWLVGKAVDCIAEDMTKAGIELVGENDPKDFDKLHKAMVKKLLWKRLQETLKWSRLYGGALAVIMIDGQKTETPLRIDTVGKGQFQGLIVLDRWMVDPSFNNLVTDPASPDLGFPKFYTVTADAPALPRMKIHHSRCIRFIGIKLPYWQEVSENLWGMSVIERLYDRLVAFDSATQGASQLLYKAYLRTLSIPNLRELIAAGGAAYEGLLQQVALMRNLQSNEGMSIIDAEDKFEGHQYSFSGISDTILQFGQQLSGAIDTPLVRLFGQSPAGLNSTGESDMRIYEDGIGQRQESDLRNGLDSVLRIEAASCGIKLDDSFSFTFRPLSKLTDSQKAEIAKSKTETVMSVEEKGIIGPDVALKELKQQSRETGVWTNITDEDIEAAKSMSAPGVDEALDGLLGGEKPVPLAEEGGSEGRTKAPAFAKDSLPLIEFQGLPICIENLRGTRRQGNGWQVIMPADYGYIRRTGSAEGPDEGMDVFVGEDAQAPDIWVVDTAKPDGSFDEHKCMLGFGSEREAIRCFKRAYTNGSDRIIGIKRMSVEGFKQWLETDVTIPEAH